MKDLKTLLFLMAFIVPAFSGATTPEEPDQNSVTEASLTQGCCHVVNQSAAERSPEDTLRVVNSDLRDPKKTPANGKGKAVRDE